MIWMYTCSLNKVAKVAPQAFDLATLAIRLNEIGDPYESFPVFESQRFLLRAIRDEDIEDLLAVYSGPKSQPFFNSGNCHGDDFRYETLERMRQAMDFWDYSYKNRFFIRWAIVDKRSKSAIGTIEAFARHAGTHTMTAASCVWTLGATLRTRRRLRRFSPSSTRYSFPSSKYPPSQPKRFHPGWKESKR